MLPSPLANLLTTVPVTEEPSGAIHCGGPAGPCFAKLCWMPPWRVASTLSWVKA